MLKRKLGSEKGFTLVELMVVVAIIAVLAAVAIPSFLRFLRSSRASEVPNSFSTINKGAVSFYNSPKTTTTGTQLGNHFPNGLSPNGITSGTYSQPTRTPCNGGNSQYTKTEGKWLTQPWKGLGFELKKAHYFQYVYRVNNGFTGSNPSYTIYAHSDLDCDGLLSTYHQITTKIDNVPATGGIITKNGGE